MTTDANAPAALVPTRAEIDEILKDIGLDWHWHDHETAFIDADEIVRARNAIIALYAPALARLEKERDEARAVEDQAVGRLQDVLSEAEAALATAEAEGMRKAAGIAGEYWTAVIAGHGHVPADPIEAMTKAAQEIEAAILWQTARPK